MQIKRNMLGVGDLSKLFYGVTVKKLSFIEVQR